MKYNANYGGHLMTNNKERFDPIVKMSEYIEARADAQDKAAAKVVEYLHYRIEQAQNTTDTDKEDKSK